MEYFSIGKIAATFGVSGEMVLVHSLGKKTSLKGLEVLFVEERKNSFLPYFIEQASIKSEEEVYIKLEGIEEKELAKKMLNKQVWLAEADFKKFASGKSPVSLLGYMMVNEEEELGPILEIIEQPHQVLSRLEIDGKEVLIPIHEESLIKVDKKNRRVFVSLPDGLLDIYLT